MAVSPTDPPGCGSQFFITLADGIDYLDGKHAVFGHVVEGFEVLDRINEAFLDKDGRPLQDIRIRHVEVLGESSCPGRGAGWTSCWGEIRRRLEWSDWSVLQTGIRKILDIESSLSEPSPPSVPLRPLLNHKDPKQPTGSFRHIGLRPSLA